jgi:hypothetical protein
VGGKIDGFSDILKILGKKRNLKKNCDTEAGTGIKGWK